MTTRELRPHRLLEGLTILILLTAGAAWGQHSSLPIDTSMFSDGAHHWWDIREEDRVVHPVSGQQRLDGSRVVEIADNILRYQKANGGWPKNYDMLAVLTAAQCDSLRAAVHLTNTTIDNGATHGQISYLARAARLTGNPAYQAAVVRGIRYLLRAQYPQGGWPQFFPDTSGYRRFITFNDGAMTGVLTVFRDITQGDPAYAFLSPGLRDSVRRSFDRGVACILRCQVVIRDDTLAWGQQHDDQDFRPQHARTFEPPSLGSGESAEILALLMSLRSPSREVIAAIEHAVAWLQKVALHGIRVNTVDAPPMAFQYHATTIDRVVVVDSTAPPIWARLYELGTNRPLFCNRDGVVVYALAEVQRERRTGYAWYTTAPSSVLAEYPSWRARLK